MGRGIWVQHPITGELIEPHLYYRPNPSRSELSAPMLIRDTMEPTLNPANGRKYDSKRAYEKAVRAAGCEIVGNETPKQAERKQDDPVNEIQQAFAQVEARAPKVRRKKKRAH